MILMYKRADSEKIELVYPDSGEEKELKRRGFRRVGEMKCSLCLGAIVGGIGYEFYSRARAFDSLYQDVFDALVNTGVNAVEQEERTKNEG